MISQPEYDAEAIVRVARYPNRVLGTTDVGSLPFSRFDADSYDRTQHRIARSRPVLVEAARLLEQAGVEPPAEEAHNLVPWLKNGLTVDASVDDELVAVRFRDVDPVRGAAVATAIAEAWGAVLDRRRNDEIGAVRAWLIAQGAEQRRTVDDASKRYVEAMRTREGDVRLVSARAAAPGARSAWADAEVDAALAAARAAAARSALRDGAASAVLDGTAGLGEVVSAGLAEARLDAGRAALRWWPEHPDALAAVARVDLLERSRDTRAGERVAALEAEAAAARDLADRARADVSSLDTILAGSRSTEVDQAAAELAVAERLHRLLAVRLAEVDLVGALPRRRVELVEAAAPPSAPAWPKPLEIALAALLLGGLGGVTLAAGAEVLDRTLRDADAVRAVGYPVLAVLDASAEPAHGAAWAVARLRQVAARGPGEGIGVWLVPAGPVPVAWVAAALCRSGAGVAEAATDPSAPHGAFRLDLSATTGAAPTTVDGWVLVARTGASTTADLLIAARRLEPAGQPWGVIVLDG